MGLYNYGNIAKSTGLNKPGACKLLIAPLSYLSSIKKPTASSSAGDTKTISQTHTFESGKGFIEALGNVRNKNTAKGSAIGELGSRSMKVEITAMVAGLNAPLLELLESGTNEDWIVLLEDGCCEVGNPKYMQFGCEDVPANMTAEIDYGTIEGGFKGATLKFESYGVPNVYTGTVTLYS